MSTVKPTAPKYCPLCGGALPPDSNKVIDEDDESVSYDLACADCDQSIVVMVTEEDESDSDLLEEDEEEDEEK